MTSYRLILITLGDILFRHLQIEVEVSIHQSEISVLVKELTCVTHWIGNVSFAKGVPSHIAAVIPSWHEVKVFLWFRHFVISAVFSTHPPCHGNLTTVSVQPSMDYGTHSRISHPGNTVYPGWLMLQGPGTVYCCWHYYALSVITRTPPSMNDCHLLIKMKGSL